MRTRGKMAVYTSRRGLRTNRPCLNLHLRLLASGTRRERLWFKLSYLWYFLWWPELTIQGLTVLSTEQAPCAISLANRRWP